MQKFLTVSLPHKTQLTTMNTDCFELACWATTTGQPACWASTRTRILRASPLLQVLLSYCRPKIYIVLFHPSFNGNARPWKPLKCGEKTLLRISGLFIHIPHRPGLIPFAASLIGPSPAFAGRKRPTGRPVRPASAEAAQPFSFPALLLSPLSSVAIPKPIWP